MKSSSVNNLVGVVGRRFSLSTDRAVDGRGGFSIVVRLNDLFCQRELFYFAR